MDEILNEKLETKIPVEEVVHVHPIK